jgi:hypothetical protein
MEEALRAVQITLLFVATMLWLGAQAAQTEPSGPTVIETAPQPVAIANAG